MEQKNLLAIAKEWQLHAKDTGSADVQIALLTNHINELSAHLQKNVKDHSSRRGLIRLVNQRERLREYLIRTSPERYEKLRKGLNLRK